MVKPDRSNAWANVLAKDKEQRIRENTADVSMGGLMKVYCYNPKVLLAKPRCVKASNYKVAAKKLGISAYEMRTYGWIDSALRQKIR